MSSCVAGNLKVRKITSCATRGVRYEVLRRRRSNFQNKLLQIPLPASWSRAFADPETSKSNQANIRKHLASHSRVRQSTAANASNTSRPVAEIRERPDARTQVSLRHRPVLVLLAARLNLPRRSRGFAARNRS